MFKFPPNIYEHTDGTGIGYSTGRGNTLYSDRGKEGGGYGYTYANNSGSGAGDGNGYSNTGYWEFGPWRGLRWCGLFPNYPILLPLPTTHTQNRPNRGLKAVRRV